MSVPFLVKLAAPFTISSAVRSLLEVSAIGIDDSDREEQLFTAKSAAAVTWAYCVCLLALAYALEAVLRIWPFDKYFRSGLAGGSWLTMCFWRRASTRRWFACWTRPAV